MPCERTDVAFHRGVADCPDSRKKTKITGFLALCFPIVSWFLVLPRILECRIGSDKNRDWHVSALFFRISISSIICLSQTVPKRCQPINHLINYFPTLTGLFEFKIKPKKTIPRYRLQGKCFGCGSSSGTWGGWIYFDCTLSTTLPSILACLTLIQNFREFLQFLNRKFIM